MKSPLTADPLGQRFTLFLAAAALAFAIAVLALALPANAAPEAAPGSVSAMSAACGSGAPNKEKHRVNDAAFRGPANQRTGSSTGCPAIGVLQPTDDAVYFCFTHGTGGTWTYLQNLRTGVRGWVLDSLLREGGSHVICSGGPTPSAQDVLR